MQVSAVIVCAGKGQRMNSVRPKQYLELAGRAVIAWTIEAFEKSKLVDMIVLVVPPGDQTLCHILERERFAKVTAIVEGGRERQDSVANGLRKVPAHCDYVVVHDGVRPLVLPDVIDRVLRTAEVYGAAIAAVRSTDTLKIVDETGAILSTPDRSRLWRAQTPQAFFKPLLEKAYALAESRGYRAPDDATLVELMGHKVVVVEGSDENIKITTPIDLITAEVILKTRLSTCESGGLSSESRHRV